MANLLWLPDALRAGGCRVWEDPNWRVRSHGAMGTIRGIVGHHTAGGGDNDWLTVRDGRPDLAGPLAQCTVERDGTWRVLASGQCWHAGTGGPWLDVAADTGNTSLIGIEGVSSGRNPGDWTTAQLEAYPRGVAALLRHLGFGPDRFLFHKTWAPNRKIDIAGWPGDLAGFRADVARWQNSSPNPAPAVATQDRPVEGDDLMQTFEWPAGVSTHKLVCPVGTASQLVERAWFSMACDGELTAYDVWFQSDQAGMKEDHGRAGKDRRVWWEMPSGCTQIVVHINAAGPVGACLEIKPR